MRNHLVKIAFIFIFSFGIVQGQNSETPKKPNIILILADDLGYGDIGCYGSKRIETPFIDTMAKEGMKFTDFYAASAVCTPTRVSILTGNYPIRYNVSQHFNDREMFLNNDMLTIPKSLKKEGYTSMHIGKWHLGGLNEAHILDRENSIPGPLQHGFDSYLTMIEDPLYRAPAMREKRLYKDAGKHLAKDDNIQQPNNTHWTTLKFDAAKSFIKEQSESDKPFFLNLWLDAPHAPYEASEKGLMEKYKDRTTGQDLLYRGMVSHLDKGVGEILSELKKLGIAENTLVIFTSDNGPAYLGSPAHFKGRKTDFHEGGIRVPMIAWWPGKINKNTINKSLTSTIDLLPTFNSIGSGEINSSTPMDGIDISETFLNGTEIQRETMFFEISPRYKNSGNYVNTTDIRHKPVPNQIVRKGPWKLLAVEGNPTELYNLNEDPYERWNLIKQYPEQTNTLLAELKNWLNEPRQAIPY
ncbi:sulfatase-like hydrolase/transferase [Urechidicola vernalis]|uniref:Sulfatase-like hydrolase/transferase n=1 Tax=Urechidicola vernalis TaxID=3075600 RepID=A0ABU2Y4R3_9FLAO|nr:sulfatase-like hydrolase/transferase [Urechidicola sp. P050]MDT0552692.1 sulfatase-like hydrolase/transferase [Urechidicola sp. P050]